MLRKIRGPDGKCTDMIADDFWYHRDCMNFYLTRHVHTQEKTKLNIGCMLTKLKELKETSEEAEYEEESDDEVTPDHTIVSSYNTAKRIRMELQDQRKAEKQALKGCKRSQIIFSQWKSADSWK
ncbi:hypothetical protein SKAU_G00279140 [Synaphobranchus kaupii]|uniref:Uncharacterized protein n=1 Tax=Synaphobranchus kaupii TaxID=118154 RepID=A0A9Q1EWW1_SYNKA|nr:hypothetical protein SKAU_G00279140 [Synaphobranchus kaupii]